MADVMRLGLLVVLATVGAGARDIKVLAVTAPGLMAVMEQLGPAFTQATGHKAEVSFALVPELRERIRTGERFDVIILTRPVIDELAQQGKIRSGSRADVARTGIGVCVRAGRPKPDINSVDGFKRALRNATSITYNEAVSSGVYVATLLQRLRLADEMRGKIVPAERKPGPGKVVGVVARGEAELGLVITTDIIADTGVEFVGPLPRELQSFIVFTAAMSTAAQEPDAAKRLIDFLRTPAAIAVITTKGMEQPE